MHAKLLQLYRQRTLIAKGQGLVWGWYMCNLIQWTNLNDYLWEYIFLIEAELDITVFSVAINGLKAFSTLHYKNSFIDQIAMVQSNEHARISASDMSEMRVKWFNQKQALYGCLLTFLWILSLQSHNKVTSGRFSVLCIGDCPLGTAYLVHDNARLPFVFQRQSSDFWLSMILVLRRTR